MEILGHSQIAITANLYTHLLPEADREAAGAMQALLGAPRSSRDGYTRDWLHKRLHLAAWRPFRLLRKCGIMQGVLGGPSRTRTCDRPIMSRQL